MKKTLIKLLLAISILSLPRLGITNSYMKDSETAQVDLSAGCWGEGLDCVSADPFTSLYFYARDDKHAVGFSLIGISAFQSIEYQVIYTREGDDGEIEEVVNGSLDNSSGDDSKTYEWIELGTCSEGGVCIYHEGVETVSIEVNLHGPFDRTLSTNISL